MTTDRDALLRLPDGQEWGNCPWCLVDVDGLRDLREAVHEEGCVAGPTEQEAQESCNAGTPRGTLLPEFLDMSQLARALRCSTRHVRRLAAARQIPEPVRLGTLLRWNGDEISNWIARGCPPQGPDPGGK